MLKIAHNKQLNQVSLTGIRALVLLGLLIEAPRSLEEIRQIFIKYKIMDENTSNDILRIDINTLRTMGCIISKASPSTNNKYILEKHIFNFDIEVEELKVLKKAYNRIKDSGNLYLLLEYDELFKKLANYINNKETIENLLGISILKTINIDILKKLINFSNTNKIIEIEYKNPVNKISTKKRVIIKNVIIRNDKFYIFCLDYNKKVTKMLNIKNILNIVKEYFNTEKYDTETTNIIFLIKDFDLFQIENNETIIENSENNYLIKGKYFNEFLAIQRILSLGENCTVIEPTDFKNKIINKLKKMKEIYKNE